MEALREHLRDDPVGRRVHAIGAAIRARGGRALLVGGAVRDALLGQPSKDLDVETFGLGLPELSEVLGEFGEVMTVGQSFGVLMIRGLDVDFSLPRRDSKTGAGHRGFEIQVDPELDFSEAARRRDLTINAIGFDLVTGELLDPHGGVADLEAGRLRATDPQSFSEDPLRGLRVAQFAARFEMEPDAELTRLCSQLDLSELPGERLGEEFNKLLLKGRKPSLGLRFLDESDLIRFFPELAELRGVPQDAEWHPEGDVWIHTLMVLDSAAELRTGDPGEDAALMFAALCHDLGKPATTEVIEGRIRSRGHESAGLPPTSALLERLRISNELIRAVGLLVLHHLSPTLFVQNGAGPRAYRRLARELAAGGVSMELLERIARADQLGRTTEEALRGEFEAGEAFLEKARQLAIPAEGPKDVVLGRHLIARGLSPSKRFGEILSACREVQDERGWTDPERILDLVLTGEQEGPL
jgi:tRNA nucleotidyltransferase (CCA-adding enzyme)